MDIQLANEIVTDFRSQENIGLALDHQDYAGDLVEEWNIDAEEWIRENYPDADDETVANAAHRIEEAGPWVYTDRED
ncbi:hypothetical protein [Mesorhizobium sp.]|uniref:hypothetical protein n=1 Tax=Mesorhizobium sp. TaxID=1871066 RepID=UPI0012048041|nr:hypothetical protein [Mesorhizobium sp.]TIV59099.1 MAG: hypothetical protein E5V80_15485 [Mesorhizobium sp.]